MSVRSSAPTISLAERSHAAENQPDKLPKWLFLSLLFHGALILTFFIVPLLPSRTAPPPPVYTVDLVGGEKIGGMKFGTKLVPAPAPKEAPKKAAPEPAPPQKKQTVVRKEKEVKPQTVEKKPQKTEKPKPVEKPAALAEKIVAKNEVKKEAPKKEPDKQEAKTETKPEDDALDNVRERLIQSAVERAKNRAQNAQKTAKEEVINAGPGEGEGAAAFGRGGRGGGVVKGMDFIIYQNRLFSTIKDNWTWIGQRSSLKVTVRFGIKDNGEVTALRVMRPSGDPSYDESVLRAVRKSSPLPAPPESYRKDFSDVEITFRPKDLGAS